MQKKFNCRAVSKLLLDFSVKMCRSNSVFFVKSEKNLLFAKKLL